MPGYTSPNDPRTQTTLTVIPASPVVVDEELQQLGRRRLTAHPAPDAAVRRPFHGAGPNVDAAPYAHWSPLPSLIYGGIGHHLQQVLNHLVLYRWCPGAVQSLSTAKTDQRRDPVHERRPESNNAPTFAKHVTDLAKASRREVIRPIVVDTFVHSHGLHPPREGTGHNRSRYICPHIPNLLKPCTVFDGRL